MAGDEVEAVIVEAEVKIDTMDTAVAEDEEAHFVAIPMKITTVTLPQDLDHTLTTNGTAPLSSKRVESGTSETRQDQIIHAK